MLFFKSNGPTQICYYIIFWLKFISEKKNKCKEFLVYNQGDQTIKKALPEKKVLLNSKFLKLFYHYTVIQVCID